MANRIATPAKRSTAESAPRRVATSGGAALPQWIQDRYRALTGRVILEAYERAKLLLRRNTEVLHKMAEALLEREVIDGGEIDEILRQYGNQNGGLRDAAAATA